jgi:hypothetical protein
MHSEDVVSTQTYWPGTQVPKSQGNAFDCKSWTPAISEELRRYQVKANAGLRGALKQPLPREVLKHE